MPERKLSALEARKRLLIAESDLNRGLLAQDYHALADGVRQVTEPVKHLAGWLSKAGAMVTLIRLFARRKSHDGAPRRSWLATRLLRLGVALWVGLRGQRNGPEAARESAGRSRNM